MELNEKIWMLRKQSGMSQEKAAEQLNVSRQALSRWENGTAQPSANNLLEISKLFGVTTDYLLGDKHPEENKTSGPAHKKDNRVRQANLTMIAIVAQAAVLNVVIHPVDEAMPAALARWFQGIPLLLLLGTSVWMACNHRYEPDAQQRAKNTKIELGYCCVQALAALTAYGTQLYFLGTVLLMAICFLYLWKINPKYMNRRFQK